MLNALTRRFGAGRLALAGVAGLAGLSLSMGGVFAGLNAVANNTTAQAVGSGTLKLTMAANGTGFSTSVSNLAPGDIVNRYVDLTNGGTIDGSALTLGVSDGTSNKLTTDATNGLHATVSACTGGTWTATSGVCSGTTSALLSNAPLATLTATPGTLVAGAVNAGTVYHLQVSLTLPNQTETTTNGTLPTGTIQGLSSSLTWTFTEAQRAGTTTNS